MKLTELFQAFTARGKPLRFVLMPVGVFGYHAGVQRVGLAAPYPAAQFELERILQPDKVLARGQAFRRLKAVYAGVLATEQKVTGTKSGP